MRFVIFALLLLPGVFALGISPPSVQLDFSPDKTYDFDVRLMNHNAFPLDVTVSTEDTLLKFSVKETIHLPASGSTNVPIKVTMPKALPRPGYYTALLSFTEHYDDELGGTTAARVGVNMRVTVWQPYPGSYAELSVFADNVGQGNNTRMTARINNLGTDAIDNGRILIDVLTPQGQLQKSYIYDAINVSGNSNFEKKEVIPASTFAPGRYTLKSKLEYNGKLANSTTEFIIGARDVDVRQLEGPIYLNKPINKYAVHVENLWNLPLDNVFAVLRLGSIESTTSPVSLGPFGRTALTGFWETDATVVPGDISADVTVFYDGSQKHFKLPIQVLEQEPVDEPASAITLSASDLLLIVAGLLLFAVIVMYLRGRKKEP